MTRFAINQTIPLSQSTRNAWRQQGAVIYRRERTLENVIEKALNEEMDFVLNYGSRTPISRLHPTFLWNPPETITRFNYPSALRTALPTLVPPRPGPDDYPVSVWLKAPGQRGQGKTKIVTNGYLVLPDSWDWQLHVEGQEYRAITVGPRMVQGFLREGDNDARTYEWTGLRDTPAPVKTIAREAARNIGGATVIAWDIVATDNSAYILEGNTAPGVSAPTAERIVREINRQREENTHAL